MLLVAPDVIACMDRLALLIVSLIGDESLTRLQVEAGRNETRPGDYKWRGG